MKSLAQIATQCGLDYRGTADITGATHDSRRVQPGDLYFALPGAHHHGIEYVAQALAAGALAIASDEAALASVPDVPALVLTNPRVDMAAVAAAVHGNPERQLTIIGVTGTNGKTTVSLLVRHMLRAHGLKVGVIGTLGAWIDDDVIPGARTTPESTDLYALFARMRDKDVTHVVMEVSSHGLALHRVDGVHFDIAVFTNLTQDHLDFHGDMESYFSAKSLLFERCSTAIINVSDEYGARLAARHPLAVTLGEQWNVVNATSRGTSGQSFTLEGARSVDVTVPLIGDFNAQNAALALLAASHVGVPMDLAAAALVTFPGVPGRLERVGGLACAAFVDYAHTPDAVARVLTVLDSVTSGALITVLGCGGDRDSSKRIPMGRIAAQTSDVVIVTDDNPRSEDPAAIRSAVAAGAQEGRARVVEIADRREAIRYALSAASADDVVAVLGKGHEQGQEVAGTVYPFDDRDVIRQESGHA